MILKNPMTDISQTRAGRAPTSLFAGQAWHLLLLVLLLGGAAWLANLPACRSGSLLGLATSNWIALAIAASVGHQLWVLFWWRLELHRSWGTRTFGRRAFPAYAAGFVLFSAARIFAAVGAAVANRGSAELPGSASWTVAAALLLPVLWLVVSIARYFGFVHAIGADHFFDEHRQRGLCRQGIFRYLPNAMYTVGFLVFWIPAVACSSWAGVLVAAFNHAYVWVHYWFTEWPDMQLIYRDHAGLSQV